MTSPPPAWPYAYPPSGDAPPPVLPGGHPLASPGQRLGAKSYQGKYAGSAVVKVSA